MSIARHHAEWLNLIDISGPFLTIDVLTREFPQELDYNPYVRPELKSAYEEWRDDQESDRPDPAIHNRWIGYVMDTVLEHQPDVNMATGQAIPPDLKLVSREFGEVRPQIVIHNVDEPSQARLLVLAYPYNQSLERQVHGNASAASPATQMMELLHATDVRLGLVTNGEQWMLVHAKPGETTSFITWYADLWIKEALTLRAFISLLGIARFFMSEDKTLEALMAESASAQHEVTDQLGYQVREAVEILIQAIDRIDKARNRELLVDVNEDRLYEAALTVMMRLVFLMSAEERELLLLGDQIYDQHYAVTTLRAQLREVADLYGEEILERRFDAWSRLLAVFRGVHGGIQHENLRLPAYGGSLFDPDRFPFLEGRESGTHWRTSNDVPLTIDNRTTLHLLEALQILRVKIPGGGMAEARRLSFRALSVTQIGHVYEGLLDHEARRADDYVLGFEGTKYKDPEIPLAILEGFDSRTDLENFLTSETGRSASAIRNGLNNDPDPERVRRLRIVCGTDTELFDHVVPFLNLLRDDDRGKPYLVFPGGVYVTAGATRRATGTHYTPESLTIPIVKHTLEPLVYRGPAEGWDEADWQLKTPAELLELKICDMAMGSGAFLVQVVEYLSDRLLEAWEQIAQTEDKDINEIIPRVLPHGERSEGQLREEIISPDDRKTLAKRLVADRCIYGVDKNPLAVEMGKLSLWLTTLSKGRAFTFLDHALKCGDSLVGVNMEQLRYWKLHPERNSDGEIVEMEQMIGQRLQPIIDYAIEKRRQLESFTVMNVGDQQAKAQLFAEAEAATAYLKTAADHLIAETMGVSEGSILADVVATFKAIADEDDLIVALSDHPLQTPDGLDFPPFHWGLEYPEVFQRGGFDAFVGNPPFMGGQFITGAFGRSYREHLVNVIAEGQRGSADFCAYFFLQNFNSLRATGCFGLLATKTISEGETRSISLEKIVKHKHGTVYRAVRSRQWPGDASLEIAHVFITKKTWNGNFVLEDQNVEGITDFLYPPTEVHGEPYKLRANENKSYQGSIPLGTGFVLESSEAEQLITMDRKNRDVLFPYMNGSDLNSRYDQSPSRWVINFEDRDEEAASYYTEPMRIVRNTVKPQRETNNRKVYREKWWQHAERRPALYEHLSRHSITFICSEVTKHLCFALVPTGIVFTANLDVFPEATFGDFACMQSWLHDGWARLYSSYLETRLKYSPGNAFETFPFPSDVASLEAIGESYHETRREIMLNRQEGLTDTYNRFHDPEEDAEDIQNLRGLHVEMDNAVASAYGWDDLDLEHDFHETAQGVRFTISEKARREVLTRLLKLNHERYAQECHEGLHKPKDCAQFFAEHPEYQRKGKVDWEALKKRKKVEDQPEQLDMFEDDNPQKRLL